MRTSLLSNPRQSAVSKMLWATIAVAVFGLMAFFWRGAAAADQYVFLVRGDVVQVDDAAKTIKINSRFTSSAGENDFAGQTVEVDVSKAAFYKYDNKLRKVRTTLGAFEVGHEIVIRGAKKSGGNYNASWVVRNDHTVNIRGTVDSQNVQDDYIKITVDKIIRAADKKAYRTATFKAGDVITVYYDADSTKFVSRDGNAMNEDEIADNGEKITLENVEVRYGSRFVAGPDATITDGRYKF